MDFTLLERAPYGAYALGLDDVVVFWNVRAEAILGYLKADVIGRRLSEVMREGASCLSAQGSKNRPPVCRTRVLCANGESKVVTLMPVVFNVDRPSARVLVHIFHEDRGLAEGVDLPHEPLTRKEMEIVRLLAQGFETPDIAEQLVLSRHTVQNHIRNAREKFGARSRLSLLVKAMRRGLLEFGESEI